MDNGATEPDYYSRASYTGILHSEFLFRQSRRWRLERNNSVMIMTVVITGSVLLTTLFWFIFRMVTTLMSNSQIVTEVVILDAIMLLTFAIPIFFATKLKEGGEIALQLLESSSPYHYLFSYVDFEDDESKDISVKTAKYIDRTKRFQRVNVSMTDRLNWFAFNAYPKIYLWNFPKLYFDLGYDLKKHRLHIYRDKTDRFDRSSVFFAVVFAVWFFTFFRWGFLGSLSSYLLLTILRMISFIALNAFALLPQFSRLSYKAALIKLLADRWPWELR